MCVLLAFAAFMIAVPEQHGDIFLPWYGVATHLAIGIGSGLLVLAVIVPRDGGARPWPLRVLGSPIAAWVGTISYGIYLWHLPALQLIERALLPHPTSASAVSLRARLARCRGCRRCPRSRELLPGRAARSEAPEAPRAARAGPGFRPEPARFDGRPDAWTSRPGRQDRPASARRPQLDGGSGRSLGLSRYGLCQRKISRGPRHRAWVRGRGGDAPGPGEGRARRDRGRFPPASSVTERSSTSRPSPPRSAICSPSTSSASASASASPTSAS